MILVFLPVFFLEGLAGTLFRSMGYAYVPAILVSLLVALTVTPAMCMVLLRNIRVRPVDPPLLGGFKWIYAASLPWFLRHSRSTVLVALLLFVASLAVVPWLGGEFLPDFRESNLNVTSRGKPDLSLVESMRADRQFAEDWKVDGVKSIAQQVGRTSFLKTRGNQTSPNLGSHSTNKKITTRCSGISPDAPPRARL